jgi:hypothetical protein
MKRQSFPFAFFCIAFYLFSAGSAFAEVKGRFTSTYFKNEDEYTGYSWDIWSARVKLKATDFYGDNKTINLDGRVRGALDNDYNDGIQKKWLKDANLEVRDAFLSTDYVIGRQYVGYLPGARVDGLHLRHHVGKSAGVGLFGGLLPDPYQDVGSSDFSSYGLYGFLREKGYGSTGGYFTSMYKGKEDMSFLYLDGDYRLDRNLSLSSSARADHKVDEGGYELTNFMAGFNYRFGRAGRVGLRYHQYRAVKLYESMEYSLNHDLQKTYRLSGNYNVARSTRLYLRYDHRTRESDGKSADTYILGARESDLFGYFYTDLSYRHIRYFTSMSDQYRFGLGVELLKSLNGELNVTKILNDQDDAPNRLEQTMYGASLDWYYGKSFYATASYEVSTEKYLDIESIYTAKVDSEWKTSSLFLILGYRF